MNAISVFREQIQWTHEFLDMVTADVTPEQAHWLPPGIANPLGAIWAHAVLVEDGVVQTILRGGTALYASNWADKLGLREPSMKLDAVHARQLRLDLVLFRHYTKAVYAATDGYLASLGDGDLDRQLDLSSLGFGPRNVGWVLNILLVSHSNNMIGEISCLKGLQGAMGYPF